MLTAIEKKIKSIPKTAVSALVGSLIAGFSAHYFIITTKLTNSDDIRQTCDELRDIKYGRWLHEYVSDITGNLSMPFDCLLALIYIAIAAVVAAQALNLRSRVTSVMLGAIMATFPMVTFSNLFNSTADIYAFAILLMTMGAFFAVRGKNKVVSSIASVVLITASLSIYQAFFGLALAIMILAGISGLMYEDKPFKEVLLDEVRYLVISGVSMGAYLWLAKKIMEVTGTKAYDYQGIDKMGELDISTLPESLRHSYTKSIGFYLWNERGVHYRFLTVLLIVMVLATAVMFVIRLVRVKKGWLEIVLAIALTALLPMAAGIIYLMGVENIHLLTVYGFVTLLFLPVLLADRMEASALTGKIVEKVMVHEKIYQGVVLAALFFTVFNYVTLSNKVYTVDWYIYEESYSYAQTIASVIRETPGHDNGTTIYMVGQPAMPTYAVEEFYEDDPRLYEFDRSGLDRDFNATFSTPSFFWYYLGLTNSIRIIEPEEAESICGCELSVFPEEGSVWSGDGDIVIRFE